MNKELEALDQAMQSGAFDTARDLATNYVRAHPEEFETYRRLVEEAPDHKAAIQQIVKRVTAFRNLDMHEDRLRAEAFHLHHYEPQNIGADFQPAVRNALPDAQPTVRKHK